MPKFTTKSPYNVLLDLGIGTGAVDVLTSKGIEVAFSAGKMSFVSKEGHLLSFVTVSSEILIPLLKGGKIAPVNKQNLGVSVANAIKQAHLVDDLNKKSTANVTANVFDENINVAAHAVAQGIAGDCSGLVTSFLDDHEKKAQENCGDGWLSFIDEDEEEDDEPVEEVDSDCFTVIKEMIVPYDDGVEKVDLGKAHLMYQSVKGTDKSSVYHVVAIGSAFNVAARLQNKVLSIRVDWDLSKDDSHMDQITEISKIGFDAGTGSKSTHMSMHLACDTHDTATKALGAVVVALANVTGAGFKTPAPVFKQLMSAAI